MAIKGYFGTPGSGKTYEVVKNVILPALALGRRVVTNIAGLEVELIIEFLEAEGVPQVEQGVILYIQLTDAIIGKFAVIIGDGEDAKLDEAQSVVRGGDMVVLDEIWRIWEEGNGCKLHPDDLKFLRMHRHLAHPKTGITLDIAVVAQNFEDVHRKVRSLIEERYMMKKHISLGSMTRYVITITSKGARNPHVVKQGKYDKKYFSLYKSNSMAGASGAREVQIDGRGNVLKSAFFVAVIPFFLVLGLVSYWFLSRYFTGKTGDAQQQAQKMKDVEKDKSKNPLLPALPDDANKITRPPPNQQLGQAFGGVDVVAPSSLLNAVNGAAVYAPHRIHGVVLDGGSRYAFVQFGGSAGTTMMRLPDDAIVIGQMVVFPSDDGVVSSVPSLVLNRR